MNDDERRGFETAMRLAGRLSPVQMRLVWALYMANGPVTSAALDLVVARGRQHYSRSLLPAHIVRLRRKLEGTGLRLIKRGRSVYQLLGANNVEVVDSAMEAQAVQPGASSV